MSERIDYNNIRFNDPRYKDFETTHTAGSNDITVDVYRLHELTQGHPVESVPISELEDQLDHPCWKDSSDDYVSPRTIIDVMIAKGPEGAKADYPHLAKHIEKILHADRGYPIYIHDEVIIDGSHRLAQVNYNKLAGILDQNFLTVKRISKIPPAALIHEDK